MRVIGSAERECDFSWGKTIQNRALVRTTLLSGEGGSHGRELLLSSSSPAGRSCTFNVLDDSHGGTPCIPAERKEVFDRPARDTARRELCKANLNN